MQSRFTALSVLLVLSIAFEWYDLRYSFSRISQSQQPRHQCLPIGNRWVVSLQSPTTVLILTQIPAVSYAIRGASTSPVALMLSEVVGLLGVFGETGNVFGSTYRERAVLESSSSDRVASKLTQ